MKLSEFKYHLSQAPHLELRFILPDSGRIPAHAHITEVGRIEKRFIDCGGTIRKNTHCTLQAWVANDTDHRLAPGKLVTIIDNAAALFGNEDLDVEIEYEDGLISQFPVVAAVPEDGMLMIYLAAKHTDCLAKDVCLPAEAGNGCCAAGGCC